MTNGTEAARRPRVLFVGRNRYTLPLPELAREEVGGGRAPDRLPRRSRPRRRRPAARDRPLPARAAGAAAPARRRCSSTSGCRSRAPARSRTSGPDAIVAERPVHRRRGADRAPARARAAAAGDPRGARRLAHVHAPYGSPRPRRLLAARRLDQPARRPARRRRPGALALHREPRRGGARRAGDRLLPDLHRPVRVHRGRRSCRCRSARPRSSSGCSSRTRTSTGSPTPGALVVRELPEARLVIVGKGARMRRDRAARRRAARPRRDWHPELPPHEVAAKLDDATLLVAPVALGGPRPGRDRGVRARPRRRRERRRRDPRPRARRRRGPADRPAGHRGIAQALRARALRPRAGRALRRRGGRALPRVAHDADRVRRRRCASSSTRAPRRRRRPRREAAAC